MRMNCLIINRAFTYIFRCKGRAMMGRKCYLVIFPVTILLFFLAIKYNVIEYVMQKPFREFQYPLEINMNKVVEQVLNNEYPDVRPINYRSYPEIFDNSHVCKKKSSESDDIYIIFLVKSSLAHLDHRNAIRQTWGNESLIKHVKIRTLFLLGIPDSDPAVQKTINSEQKKHKDILQGGFIDTYYNNTIKTMMGFQWVSNNCLNAQYIVFMDDDYYVNVHEMLKLLRSIEPYQRKDLVIGYLWDFVMPFRVKYSKWYISLSEYPYRYWPPYLTAGSYIITPETVRKFYIAMQYTKYLRFDDVFVGIVAFKLGIKLTHNEKFYCKRVHMDDEEFSKVIAMHGFENHEEMKNIWNKQQVYVKQ